MTIQSASARTPAGWTPFKSPSTPPSGIATPPASSTGAKKASSFSCKNCAGYGRQTGFQFHLAVAHQGVLVELVFHQIVAHRGRCRRIVRLAVDLDLFDLHDEFKAVRRRQPQFQRAGAGRW